MKTVEFFLFLTSKTEKSVDKNAAFIDTINYTRLHRIDF